MRSFSVNTHYRTMPRRYRGVLPTRTRPSLFVG